MKAISGLHDLGSGRRLGGLEADTSQRITEQLKTAASEPLRRGDHRREADVQMLLHTSSE